MTAIFILIQPPDDNEPATALWRTATTRLRSISDRVSGLEILAEGCVLLTGDKSQILSDSLLNLASRLGFPYLHWPRWDADVFQIPTEFPAHIPQDRVAMLLGQMEEDLLKLGH